MIAPTLRRAAGRTALVVFATSLAFALPSLDRPPMLDEASGLGASVLVERDPRNPYRAAARLASDERVDPQWARRVPPPLGWPYLLAAARALAGSADPAALRLLAVLPMLAVAALGLSALTHRFCRRPVLAALAVALSAPYASASASLLSDLPALGVGLFGLALLVRGGDRGEVPTAVLGGLLLGLAPTVGFGAAVFAGLGLLYAGLHRGPTRAAAAGCLAIAAAPAAWGWQVLDAARVGSRVAVGDASGPGPWAMLAVNAVLLPGALPLLAATALAALARGAWERRATPWVGLLLASALAAALPPPAGGRAPQIAFALAGLVASGILLAVAGDALATSLPAWCRRPAAGPAAGGEPDPEGLPPGTFHADRLFLGAWVLAVPVAAALVQSYGAYRLMLPALPAAAILACGVRGGPPRRPLLSGAAAGAALAVSAALAAAVVAGDHLLARAGAASPSAVAAAVDAPPETVWSATRGGLGLAMEEAGHPPLSVTDLKRLGPRTRVVVSESTPRPPWLPRGVLEACALPEATVPLPSSLPLRVLDPRTGAGFHASTTGLLPVSWSREPLDVLTVWRVEGRCGLAAPAAGDGR
ncbi:hypothetical protein L6R50_25355 [Myxococcota bacterium]|nr:hypothetical protein [Myxococcota bacterium]